MSTPVISYFSKGTDDLGDGLCVQVEMVCPERKTAEEVQKDTRASRNNQTTHWTTDSQGENK